MGTSPFEQQDPKPQVHEEGVERSGASEVTERIEQFRFVSDREIASLLYISGIPVVRRMEAPSFAYEIAEGRTYLMELGKIYVIDPFTRELVELPPSAREQLDAFGFSSMDLFQIADASANRLIRRVGHVGNFREFRDKEYLRFQDDFRKCTGNTDAA